MARPKEHKPETILAAALSLFRSEGVNVSTARIAKQARVSNGTLFNYFPTKQELIDALYVSIKTELAAAVSSLDEVDSIDSRMKAIWERWLGWARDNRDAHHVVNLLHESGMAGPDAQLAGMALLVGPVSVLEEALDVGLLVDLPLEHLGALIQHHLNQAVASDLNDQQAEVAFGVLWNGITEKEIQLSKKD